MLLATLVTQLTLINAWLCSYCNSWLSLWYHNWCEYTIFCDVGLHVIYSQLGICLTVDWQPIDSAVG